MNVQVQEKKNSVFIYSQKIPRRHEGLFPKEKLKKVATLLGVWETCKESSNKELQAFCFTKVVQACEKACRNDAFYEFDCIATHIVGLKSLQGKSVYEAVFANLDETSFQNLLKAAETNQNLLTLLKQDYLFIEHKRRIQILESFLNTSASRLGTRLLEHASLVNDTSLWMLSKFAEDSINKFGKHIVNTGLRFSTSLIIERLVIETVQSYGFHWQQFFFSGGWEKRVNKVKMLWEKSVLKLLYNDSQLKKLLIENRTDRELITCSLVVSVKNAHLGNG